MRVLLFILLLLPTPLWAQESILLNVNQTHTLQWDWAETEGPVRSFVFQCQQYRKDLEADARSLRFSSLVDQPGRYTGCTLSAKNETGLSAPVIVPDFDYSFAYGPLGWLFVECLAGASALAGLVRFGARRIVKVLRRDSPLALPEPVIVMQKEREHADRYR